MAQRGMGLSGLGGERLLGVLVGLAKIGPAVPDPLLYRVLKWIGVLQKLPSSWPDSSRLDQLPWGGLNDDKLVRAELPVGIDGPWPQQPVLQEGLSPPVLNLSREDRGEHLRYNITRYLGQIVRLTPGAAWRTLVGPRLVPVDDATFAGLFADTSLAQFIRMKLDPADRETFAGMIPAGEEAAYGKVDFSAMGLVGEPLPGVHAAATVSLVRSLGDGAFRFEAIAVGRKLVTPGDGDSWALAKYFVLQGAQMHMVMLVHPRMHFPQDAVNALTWTLLPQGHLLYKLLRPHGEITLGLHEATLHHRRSVAHNSQREIYTPFAFPTDAIHMTVALGNIGVAGNSAYPPFRFGDFLPGTHTRYGRFRQDWFDAVLDFCAAVAAEIPRDDPYVRAWADHVAAWVPGFPRGDEIFDGDALARAAANYICAVSIFHTADHHSFSGITLNLIPWRIRVPPPDIKAPQGLDLDALVSREDFFRHQLFVPMFVKPVIVRGLREARYNFRAETTRTAEARFRAAMDVIDARWAGSTFPSSAQIAVSTQY